MNTRVPVLHLAQWLQMKSDVQSLKINVWLLIIRCIKWGKKIAFRCSRWTEVRLFFFDLFLKCSLFFIMEDLRVKNKRIVREFERKRVTLWDMKSQLSVDLTITVYMLLHNRSIPGFYLFINFCSHIFAKVMKSTFRVSISSHIQLCDVFN